MADPPPTDAWQRLSTINPQLPIKSWQEAETLFPECGARWDLYWSHKPEDQPPVNIEIILWSPLVGYNAKPHLWIFNPVPLAAERWYSSPYDYRVCAKYWHYPFNQGIWSYESWWFAPGREGAYPDAWIQRAHHKIIDMSLERSG